MKVSTYVWPSELGISVYESQPIRFDDDLNPVEPPSTRIVISTPSGEITVSVRCKVEDVRDKFAEACWSAIKAAAPERNAIQDRARHMARLRAEHKAQSDG